MNKMNIYLGDFSFANKDLDPYFQISRVNESDRKLIDDVERFVKKNDTTSLNANLDRIELLAKYKYSKEAQIACSAALTMLNQKKSLESYDPNCKYSYWQLFWYYLLFIKTERSFQVGGKEKTSAAVFQRLKNMRYPSEYMNLLLAADSFINKKTNNGMIKFKSSNNGVVDSFFHTIILLQDPGQAPAMRIKDLDCAFFLVHYFDQEDPYVSAKKNITYTISVTSIEESFTAMLAMRSVLHWGSAEFSSKLRKLPYVIKETRDKNEASLLYESLNKKGLTVKVTGRNALGEEIKDCLGLAAKVKVEDEKKKLEEESNKIYQVPFQAKLGGKGMYTGKLKDGKPFGLGSIKFDSGSVYEGYFLNRC